MARVVAFICAFLFACNGNASLLRSNPNKQLGQNVGTIIRNADADMAADPSFQKSLTDTLDSDQEVLVNPKVSEVIAQANSMAAHETLAADNMCARNYKLSCPDGWASAGNADCVAPASYGGPCRTTQSFANSNIMEKSKFASSCNAPWPCEDSCTEGHDFDACPKSWSDIGDGFCQSPADANSKCTNMYKFDDMSIPDKQELAVACEFEWQCKTSCTQDYSQPCPEDWTNVAGLCMAPATYSGDCGYGINTSAMTEAQKRTFATQCAAKFPCMGAAGASETPLGVPSNAASSGEAGNGPVDQDTGRVITGATSADEGQVRKLSSLEEKVAIPSGPLA